MAKLVPQDFVVPTRLEHPAFTLRMLTEEDTEPDYEAVMESADRLRAGSPNGWPRPGFTLAENRADLIRHEAEHRAGEAFAYTMLDPVDDRVLGCVYFNPSEAVDADVHMWVRNSHAASLTDALFQAVDEWLAEEWPFRHIHYVRTDYYRSDAEDPMERVF